MRSWRSRDQFHIFGDNRARRTQCRSQLHQFGIALDMYVDVQGISGIYPNAADTPSVTPNLPSLPTVLAPFNETNTRVWRCPDDLKYFDKEQTSYEYRAGMAADHRRVEIIASQGLPSGSIYIVYDFDPVHAPKGTQGSRNFLYLDGHVSY